MPNRVSNKPPIPPGMRIKFVNADRARDRSFGAGITSISDPRICLAVEFNRPGELLFNELKIQILERYEELGFKAPDLTPMDKSFDLASIAHKDVFRANGQPYIDHPLELAFEMLKADWLEIPALCAALLHDSVEDTAEKPASERITIKRIRHEVGADVANLVNGLTKLRKIGLSKEIRDVKNIKKWINYISRDMRVGVLKLFDRLVNSRTFHELEPERALKNAQETMDIYVPIAHGLGMKSIRVELEENSLKILYPEESKQVAEMIRKEKESASPELMRFHEELGAQMAEWQVNMYYESESFSNILRRFSLDPSLSIADTLHSYILEAPDDICYDILGMLHRPGIYKYVQRTFEDYISNPTGSNYRALQTTLLVPGIGNVTFKIMSPEMRRGSEYGPLVYYEVGKEDWHLTFSQQYPWIEELVGYLRANKKITESELREITQGAVFTIEVFTPKGEPISIQTGATTLDFAYRIHSDIGKTALFARVHRGKRIFIDDEMSLPLRPFDRVEVMTDERLTPKLSDLDKVKTTDARHHIIAYLKEMNRSTSEENGKAVLAEEMDRAEAEVSPLKCYLRPEDLGETYKVRGVEKLNFAAYFKRLNSNHLKPEQIQRAEDLYYLVGIGQLSYEVAVSELLKFLHEGRRRSRKAKVQRIVFAATNRPGILRDIAKPIADLHLNIVDVKTRYKGKQAILTIDVRTYNEIQRIQIRNIISQVGKVKKDKVLDD